MPPVKKRNATLSNLLAYPSPKSDKRQGFFMPEIISNDAARAAMNIAGNENTE